jgi:hypothetical protein
MYIDPEITWKLPAKRLEAEKNPRIRRNLESLVKHMKSEVRGDTESVLATLSPQVVYYNYSPFGQPSIHRGLDAIRAFYDGLHLVCSALEVDWDQLCIDENMAMTAGSHKLAYTGRYLESLGAKVDDPGGIYLDTGRTVIIGPFASDGKILGEPLYRTSDYLPQEVAKRKLTSANIAGFQAG